MGKLKGTGWKGALEYLDKTYGPEGMRKLLAALDEPDRQILSKPILPISWLDFSAYIRIILTADKVLGSGDHKLIEAASVYNAQKDLKGVYKLFLSVTSPRFVISNAQRLWRQYNDEGDLSVEWRGSKEGVLYIRNYPDIPLHHELDQLPYMIEALKMSGCKNVQARHVQCIARGDEQCRTEFKWD